MAKKTKTKETVFSETIQRSSTRKQLKIGGGFRAFDFVLNEPLFKDDPFNLRPENKYIADYFKKTKQTAEETSDRALNLQGSSLEGGLQLKDQTNLQGGPQDLYRPYQLLKIKMSLVNSFLHALKNLDSGLVNDYFCEKGFAHDGRAPLCSDMADAMQAAHLNNKYKVVTTFPLLKHLYTHEQKFSSEFIGGKRSITFLPLLTDLLTFIFTTMHQELSETQTRVDGCFAIGSSTPEWMTYMNDVKHQTIMARTFGVQYRYDLYCHRCRDVQLQSGQYQQAMLLHVDVGESRKGWTDEEEEVQERYIHVVFLDGGPGRARHVPLKFSFKGAMDARISCREIKEQLALELLNPQGPQLEDFISTGKDLKEVMEDLATRLVLVNMNKGNTITSVYNDQVVIRLSKIGNENSIVYAYLPKGEDGRNSGHRWDTALLFQVRLFHREKDTELMPPILVRPRAIDNGNEAMDAISIEETQKYLVDTTEMMLIESKEELQHQTDAAIAEAEAAQQPRSPTSKQKPAIVKLKTSSIPQKLKGLLQAITQQKGPWLSIRPRPMYASEPVVKGLQNIEYVVSEDYLATDFRARFYKRQMIDILSKIKKWTPPDSADLDASKEEAKEDVQKFTSFQEIIDQWLEGHPQMYADKFNTLCGSCNSQSKLPLMKNLVFTNLPNVLYFSFFQVGGMDGLPFSRLAPDFFSSDSLEDDSLWNYIKLTVESGSKEFPTFERFYEVVQMIVIKNEATYDNPIALIQKQSNGKGWFIFANSLIFQIPTEENMNGLKTFVEGGRLLAVGFQHKKKGEKT